MKSDFMRSMFRYSAAGVKRGGWGWGEAGREKERQEDGYASNYITSYWSFNYCILSHKLFSSVTFADLRELFIART